VQIGKTKYTTNKMKILNPMPKEELEKYIQQSNYVITHGGVGSIMTALKCQKRVIAVPRLKKYEEHVNNHQLQIIEWYTKKGYILGIKDVSELKEAINKIEKFVPNKYENLTGNIIQIISDYINKN
jgi:UDP-N-acetylglucosamine transferase subunit ALG13